MAAPAGRRSNLLLVTLLLVISILLEQFFIAPILPWLSDMGSVRPMIVFLDIPLSLPAIDIIPVSILFALFYFIAPSAGLARTDAAAQPGRVWKALTGWWALLIFLLAGGGGFYLAQSYLPRNISNGIDSFGVRADITLPYPSGGLIHLHGSVVMLLSSIIGFLILRRRTAVPMAIPQPAVGEQAVELPAIQPRIAQPAAASTTRRPAAPALSSSVVSTKGDLISPTINEALAAQHVRYLPPVTTPSTPSSAYVQRPAAAAVATAPPPAQKPAIVTPEPPPTCRLTTPPPIAMVMPRPAPGIGKMHPCYVVGGLTPQKA